MSNPQFVVLVLELLMVSDQSTLDPTCGDSRSQDTPCPSN